MAVIKKVVFLLTPFQVKAINWVNPQLKSSRDTLIIKADYIELSQTVCNIESFDNTRFSRNDFLRKPFKSLIMTRAFLKAIDKKLDVLQETYTFEEGFWVYLGNDKDVYTQCFLNRFKDKILGVTAIDEGIGFYLTETAKDRILKFLYPFLSRVLFGCKILYIKRLGSHSMVTNVFLREKDMLKNKSSNVEYSLLNVPKSQSGSVIKESKVLIFSFPEQDINLNITKKANILDTLIGYFINQGREIMLKPHPREHVKLLKKNLSYSSKIKFLNESEVGEEIPYFDFGLIINFGSSVVLDLLANNYPKNRIITLGFSRKPKFCFGKGMKYIYFEELNDKNIFEQLQIFEV